MVSLVDLGPLTDSVEVRGKTFPVKGIPAECFFQLLAEIPELRRVFAEKQMSADMINALIGQAGRAVGAIIAAGTGHFGDEKQIAAAMQLPVGEQTKFLTKIIGVTFPQGPAAFLDELMAFVPANAVGALGKGAATKSQAPSNSASAPDTTQEKSGSTPQDSLPDSQQ